MRKLVAEYLSDSISRRAFVGGLTKAGLTATAAQSVLSAVTSVSYAQGAGPQPLPPASSRTARPVASCRSRCRVAGVKPFQGPGGAAFAEQLIACGVKYVFGNSASEDAQFYEALVDRPQLKYILTPHEGPGAAMAAGYIKASGEPAIVMQAGVVGMANAIGQMFNAFKEQTPLVVYSYRTDQIAARRPRRLRGGRQSGADGPADHQIHLAGAPPRHDPGDRAPRLQGGLDAALWALLHLLAFRLQRRTRSHRDHRAGASSIRACACGPIPTRSQRAAKLLVEARMPLMVVGDEIYKAKAAAKAVKLAELLGMPVTQVRQLYANFPETHPLWVGNLAGGSLDR